MDSMDSHRDPKVSVLMSVFNGEAYVADAIESILKQSYKDFEFIIIDDGSTDRSLEIIEHYEHSDSRIVLIRQSNQGLVAALNLGMKVAKAPLIARIDADDIALEQRLEKQVHYMDAHSKVLALGSSIRIIDEQNSLLRDVIYPTGTDTVAESMRKGCKVAHPSVIFRKDAVLHLGGYREICRHAEDYDLWLRLIEIGEIDNLEEPLLLYREHSNKISNLHYIQQKMTSELIKIASELRQKGVGDPLSGLDPPLSLESIMTANIPSRYTRVLYKTLLKALVKRNSRMTEEESVLLKHVMEYYQAHCFLLFNVSILKYYLRALSLN